MLSIANISSASAATHYYEKDNYYVHSDSVKESKSEWHGKGAKDLNLSGEVKKEEFENILNGDLGNSGQLGRKEGGNLVHAPGIDLTFSAPKSVSIQAEVFGDVRINEAHKTAVLRALDFIEKNLVKTRKMVNGELLLEETSNITAALFKHNVSRSLDPQLHTHCVIANATKRDDNVWRSAFFGKIFDNKMLIGQIYRSELAYELKKLGYEIRISGKNSLFELKNIPESLISVFSNRSKEIAKAAENYRNINAKIKADITLRTREYKKELTPESLNERWQNALSMHNQVQVHQKDLKPKDLSSQTSNIKSYIHQKWEAFCEKYDLRHIYKSHHIDDSQISSLGNGSIESHSLDYAISHLSQRQSVWEENDLLKHALAYSVGKSNVSNLTKEIQKYKVLGKLITGVVKDKSFDSPVSTREVLLKEQNTILLMQEGQESLPPICTKKNILSHINNSSLNKGQREAVLMVLNSKDRVTGIQGAAGTGKTYMLQHVRSLTLESGYIIKGLAPSSSANNTLESDAGIPSQTIHKFLFKYDGLINGRGTTFGKQKMKSEMARTLIVVDEASLASTTQIHALLKVSKELDFRVVLIGDSKQLNGAEEGKPFEQLQKTGMKTAIMDEIIRQKNLKLKDAVYAAINGDISFAMSKIKDNIIEPSIPLSNHDDERLTLANLAANEWLSLAEKERKNTLLTAPSNFIRKAINLEVRERLMFEGKLQGNTLEINTLESKGLTNAEIRVAQNYQVGDIILFNRANKTLGVLEGSYLTVEESDGITLNLRDENARTLVFNPTKLSFGIKPSIEVYQPRKLQIKLGEQLRWTKNSADNPHIVNSKLLVLRSINDNSLTLESRNGNPITLSLADPHLKYLDYAYATTVHSAQGKTYDNVIGVLESSHPHLTNQKSFYVTLSRAKFKAALITDNKEKLIKSLTKQTGEVLSAMDLQKNAIESKLTENYQSSLINNSAASRPSSKSKFESHSIKDIYNAMYHNLPQILPQFGFRNQNGYYVSTTECKVDGSSGKKGKVYVYSNNPGTLVDYTRGNKSIWDYIKDTYMPVANNFEMMQYLSEISGLGNTNDTKSLPNLSIHEATKENPSTTMKVSPSNPVDIKLVKAIHNYATDTLFRIHGNKVLNYLRTERGYDEITIKSMELGYIDNKKALGKHLKTLGWSEDKIKEAYKTLHFIGASHNLTIPYRDSNGDIVGFAARNIEYDEKDTVGKYLYTKGLSRGCSLLNIHCIKDKEVIVVEGMLDALHAKSKGIENVVALGGTAFNNTQLQLLNDRGVSSLVLCLDNDKAGKEASIRIQELTFKSKLNFEIKEVSLPNGIKDPDQMLRDKGAEALRIQISSAKALIFDKKQSVDLNIMQCNTTSNLNKNHAIIKGSNEVVQEL